MTGTADRRGPGGEAWPQEPQQQQDEWGQPPAAPYGGVPQHYSYEQYPQEQVYDTGQYPAPAPGYDSYGYDPYGQPLPQPQPPQQYPEPGYQYPYAPQQPQPQPQRQPQAYPAQDFQGYDTGQYTVQQPPAPFPTQAPPPRAASARPAPPSRGPAPTPAPGAPGYGTEEFTFVDDAEESEDVIDWLKFSETRGERRDERRRKLRSRGIALAVVLVLLLVGGAGYLWAKGSLFGATGGAVAASTKRQVIAIHLHDLNKNVYTALLVSDPGTGKGSTLLLPGTLGVPTNGGGATVTLSSSVDAQGNAATRDGLNTVLGTDVTATWGLYTSFLQVLVDQLGGITVDADTTIMQNGKALVSQGKGLLTGAAAIAYATYQAKGESSGAQLARFGQVLQGLIRALPQDPASAATDITRMGAVPDPSLPDATLGGLLATLSKDAVGGNYATQTLAVKPDGTLGSGAGDVVKQLLGGTVSSKGGATVARVGLTDATGTSNKINLADAAVLNGGFTLVPGMPKAASTQSSTTIGYTDDARAADAKQLAQDLGLPSTVVRKVTITQTVDLLVVLGKDYKG